MEQKIKKNIWTCVTYKVTEKKKQWQAMMCALGVTHLELNGYISKGKN
jgi:hypothetical protein